MVEAFILSVQYEFIELLALVGGQYIKVSDDKIFLGSFNDGLARGTGFLEEQQK